MSEALKVTIELAALDNGSKVLNVAFDKIASKAGRTAANISKAAFDIGKKAAIVGGLIAAPLAFATKQAVGFEDAMAGVAKVTNTQVGSHQFNVLGNNAKKAAVEIGIAADASAELMASLASGGVAQKDLSEMTVVAGKVGVAFDLAAKDAGDSFVKMRNALGITNKEAKLAADSFNFISDNDASTAAQILTYMANGGASVARTLGIAAPKMAAFGSALISMGKSGEEAATIMLRFQKAIYLKGNEDMLAKYKAAGRGAAGLMAVLKQGADIKDSDAQFKYFGRMGEYGTSVSQLAKSYGVLQKNIGLVSKESNYAGSVDKEFINRNSTVKGQLNKLKAEAGVLAVDLGSVLLPVLRDFIKDVAPLLRQLAAWIKANPQLTRQLVQGAAAMSVLSFAVSGVSSVIGGAAKAVEIFGPKMRVAGRLATSFGASLRNAAFEGTFKIYERFPKAGQMIFNLGSKFTSAGAMGTRAMALLSTGARAVGLSMLSITWPVALAIAAIAAVGYLIYKNWDKLKPMFVNTWRVIKNVAVGIYDTVAYQFNRLGNFLMNTFEPVRTFVNWIKNAFASIKMPDWMKTAGNFLSNVGGKIGRGLANAADNSAAFANQAGARRGIARNMAGAVGGRPVSPGFAASAAATAATNGGSMPAAPAPVPGRSGGSSTTVHYAPTVTIGAGASPAQAGEFKKMLQQHKTEVASIVKEENRKQARSKY